MPKFINLKTPVPGPISKEWLSRKEKVVGKPFGAHIPVMIERGDGATVVDVDGNTFTDLTGGIGCLNVGHCPTEVVRAVQEQVSRFLHTDFTVMPYTPLIELAEKLTALAPVPKPAKAIFFNSGAEAVENAVKIARYATRRQAVIAFEGAFHGRTYMAMSLTSKIKPYKKNYAPFVPEVYRISYANCYRCPSGLSYPACKIPCAEALNQAFLTMVDPENTAAVIMEPVQGESGFVVPPADFVRKIREICTRHGILLIADEVQTGFARTGKLFALENFGVEADLVTMAKSIAAGLPLSAVVGRADVIDSLDESTIGGTFVGNPVACVAALKVLELIREHDLCGRANRLGVLVMDRFRDMARKYPIIGNVRGLGAMVAVEFVKDQETKAPAGAETTRIFEEALKRGVLLLKAGTYGNAIRLLNPLTIPEEQLKEALDVLEESIAAVNG